MVLNGALSGLVAITAGPDYSSMALVILIGGLVVVFTVPMFDKLKIDDPVGPFVDSFGEWNLGYFSRRNF